MAARRRVTRLVRRFPIDRGDNRVEHRPFVQNNGGTFTFSTGNEGIIFSLSDSDLVDLLTRRGRRLRIILEEDPPPEPAPTPPKRKRRPGG